MSSLAGGGLLNKCCYGLSVNAGKGGFWSTHSEMHFVLLLAYMCFLNTYSDAFCAQTVIGCVWSTGVEIHLISSLVWDELGQHMLRRT